MLVQQPAGPARKSPFPTLESSGSKAPRIFGAPDNECCRRFLQVAMLTPAIEKAVFVPTHTPSIDLHFNVRRWCAADAESRRPSCTPA